MNKLTDIGLYYASNHNHFTHPKFKDFNYAYVDFTCDSDDQFNKALEGMKTEILRRENMISENLKTQYCISIYETSMAIKGSNEKIHTLIYKIKNKNVHEVVTLTSKAIRILSIDHQLFYEDYEFLKNHVDGANIKVFKNSESFSNGNVKIEFKKEPII